MRPIADRLTRDRRSAFGPATGQALAAVALLAGVALAGDGDVPDLPPSSEMPIVSKPANPSPAAARPPANPRSGRAMLAIPGLTTPATARPSIPLEGPKLALDAATPELSLDAPIEMRPLPEPTGIAPGAATSRSARPLVLESSPMDEPSSPGGLGGARTTSPTKRPSTPAQPVQAPARRPRFFGLIPGQAAAPASPASNSKTATPGRSFVDDEDLRDDPAAESALKRRIERQAREVVGNRARSVEVKLTGKDAVVHVAGVKFLQKRAIRKQLEGLSTLSGLRSTIEVVD